MIAILNRVWTYPGRPYGLAFLPFPSPPCSRRAGVRTQDFGTVPGPVLPLCAIWPSCTAARVAQAPDRAQSVRTRLRIREKLLCFAAKKVRSVDD